MSLENKKLIIAFSNGVQCSGLMNIHFAKTHFAQFIQMKIYRLWNLIQAMDQLLQYMNEKTVNG